MTTLLMSSLLISLAQAQVSVNIDPSRAGVNINTSPSTPPSTATTTGTTPPQSTIKYRPYPDPSSQNISNIGSTPLGELGPLQDPANVYDYSAEEDDAAANAAVSSNKMSESEFALKRNEQVEKSYLLRHWSGELKEWENKNLQENGLIGGSGSVEEYLSPYIK
ncbi:MAG: hypothetical protein HQK50_17560 [Oligoflexia bacterium]|nr:hypothetical protein [Oligoflexia bacterium]